jgi:hypothetical protein
MLNKKTVSLDIDELEKNYEVIEQQAIDLWIVLELTNADFEGSFYSQEITTIPQERFSVLRNLPRIIDVIQNKLKASAPYHSTSGSFFAVESKPHVNCQTSEVISPLKSKSFAHLVSVRGGDQDLLLDAAFIVAHYRTALFSYMDSLRQKCMSESDTIAAISRVTKDEVLCEKTSALLARYLQLIDFSDQSGDVSIPFADDKVALRIQSIYADMALLNTDFAARSGQSHEYSFLIELFKNVRFAFMAFLTKIPDDLSWRWHEIETEFTRLSFSKQYDRKDRDVSDVINRRFDTGSIYLMKEQLFSLLKNINFNLLEQDRMYTALAELSPIVRSFQETCVWDLLVEDEEMAHVDDGFVMESLKKRRKSEVVFRNREEKQYMRFLHDFAYSLFIFYSRVNLLFRATLSADSSTYFEDHDENYATARLSLAWMQRLTSILSPYTALALAASPDDAYCHRQFLKIISQFSGRCSHELKECAVTRQQYQQALLKDIVIFMQGNADSLMRNRNYMRELIFPTWVEADEKQTNLSGYAVLINLVQHYLESIPRLIQSIQLTNDPLASAAGYPQVGQQLINRLQQRFAQLTGMRDSFASEFCGGVTQWFSQVKSACSAHEITLKEMVEKHYLLSLYAANAKSVLYYLKEIFKVVGSEELGRLIKDISEFPASRCTESIQNLANAPALSALSHKLRSRLVVVRNYRCDCPPVFNLLSRYLFLTEFQGLQELLDVCLIANKRMAELNQENQCILDDFKGLGDFFADIPNEAEIVKSVNLFVTANDECKQYQNISANLCKLIALRQTNSQAEPNQSTGLITQCVKKTWGVLNKADAAFKVVRESILSYNDQQSAGSVDNWRSSLQNEVQSTVSMAAELQSAIAPGGILCDELSDGQDDLAEVIYAAFPLAVRHLEGLAENMKAFLGKLPSNRAESDTKSSFSPN